MQNNQTVYPTKEDSLGVALGRADNDDDVPLTIGDLYRLKLKRAAIFRRIAKDTTRTELLRRDCFDRALEYEIQATCLAHCIAWFGDAPLSEIDLSQAQKEIAEMTCEQRNPWAWGLSAIEGELGKQKSAKLSLAAGT